MRQHDPRGATLLLAAMLVPAVALAQGGKTVPPAGVMPMAAPVMPMAQPAVASGVVPAINGRVTSVRFYEAAFQGLPFEQRVFYSTFQRSLSRYLYWQLDIDFPALQGPVNMPIDAVWYRQDGSVFARQCDDTLSLEAGWSSARHVRGRGWDEYGNWPVGPYWLDLFVLGDRVANGQFSVVDGGTSGFAAVPPARPINPFVPSLNARVTTLKFFEAGGTAPPAEQRQYHGYFTLATTRYIYWEMHLQFPYAPRRQNFNVEAIWYAPDGSIFAHQSDASFYVDQSWTSSDHTWGRGWDTPGQWAPGSYYVELFVNGTRVGYDRFTLGT